MKTTGVLSLLGLTLLACSQTFACIIVDTGGPTNGMAMASRPDAGGKTESRQQTVSLSGPAAARSSLAGRLQGY